MRRFLVARPLNPVISPVRVGGGMVEFLHAIPIYESEVAVARSLGVPEFLSTLGSVGINYWEPDRRPLSKHRSPVGPTWS